MERWEMGDGARNYSSGWKYSGLLTSARSSALNPGAGRGPCGSISKKVVADAAWGVDLAHLIVINRCACQTYHNSRRHNFIELPNSNRKSKPSKLNSAKCLVEHRHQARLPR